jgi:two-component system phosphate regulon sensor histidine kinase PhoR
VKARRTPTGVVFAVTLAVGVAGVAGMTWVRSREEQRHTERRLAAAAEALADQAAPLLRETSAEAGAEIARWAAASGFRVTLIAADGVVHADSEMEPSVLLRLENHRHRPEVEEAASRGVGTARRHSVSTDRTTLYVAARIGTPAALAGFLRFAAEEPTYPVPWEGLALVLVSALTAAVAVRGWEARHHAAVARHLVGWSDFPAGAELEGLAEDADRHFRARRESLERELEATRAAVAEVSEGVVLLDGQAVVRFANPAAGGLLGEGLEQGRPLLEAVRAPELVSTVAAVLEGGGSSFTTCPGAAGTELAVRVCALDHPVLAAAVVVRDLGGERRLERSRRALVADLAHELRTPLTVLAGIESGQVTLHVERLDAAAVAAQVMADLRVDAERASVTLAAEGGAAPLDSDPVRLGQVLTNLVSNAIRFNRPGGHITVQTLAEGDEVVVVVQDTGVGIPEAEIPLVFQRFYRVRRDEQRSGSGLGLAIVKHLTRVLGGTVQLTSREGEGTIVTLRFPAEAQPVET